MKKRESKPSPKGVHVTGFQVLDHECIWMKAGVISFRTCDNAYDCSTCPFDKGMQKTMRSLPRNKSAGKQSQLAKDLWLQYKGSPLPCRHSLTGRVSMPKICPNNYECYHCSYDQWLDEFDQSEPRSSHGFQLATGYRLAEDTYFHHGHMWARFEHGGRIRIGFDDFLVKVFGPMVSIRLPSLGVSLKQNQIGLDFSRGERQASLLAPVSGTVLVVNQRIADHPEIVCEDPYNDGWLAILEPDMPKKNIKKLHFGKDSLAWMEGEVQQLLSMIGPEYEKLAATGGQAVNDLYGNLPELDWDKLVEQFLKT